MAINADETTQDYLLALGDEMAALDKDVQTILIKRNALCETRERLLTKLYARDNSQPERRRQKSE
jgi:hypothetical protein